MDVGRTSQGRKGRREAWLGRFAAAALVAVAVLQASPARAQFNNATPRADFAGTHNYQVTGGSLRRTANDPDGDGGIGDDDNNGIKDACDVGASDTASLTGIPVDGDTTIAAAYLYWGGSGSTVDSTVTLNGVAAPVLQTFTENFNGAGYDLDYFGGVADVTSIVQSAGGNGSYTFGNLTVNTGGGGGATDPCAPSAVVAGWALIVFYNDPDEPYRYSRIYDGLQFFRDAAVTTNQSGFRVPNFKDGKTTVVTWEGDPDAASSVPGASGSTENLNFSTAFASGDLPSPPNACNVDDEIYSSKISNNITGLCDTGSPGVDVSTFDITDFLDEGIDAAALEYSSGNDLVFLTAQVISTTNTPVIDLSVTKSHAGNFPAGGSGSFEIVVHNDGPEPAVGDNTVVPAEYTTVVDTLPAGLTYDSASGTGWTCNAAGQVVTCEHQADIPAGGDLPTLTINVDVSPTAAASLDNTVVVSHPMFDSDPGNSSDTDTVTVAQSDLSTSAKTVQDTDGGDADPNDRLRYTITLTNTGSGAATNVVVTDDIPANVHGFAVASIPAGATDASTGTGGANGTGYLEITGITVPASGSVEIVFDVYVDAVAPGTQIDNTATVIDPVGPDPTLDAETVTVSQSGIPQSGNKILYLYNDQTMTRTPQGVSASGVIVDGDGGFKDWVMTPAVPAGESLVLSAGANVIAADLVIGTTGSNLTNARPIRVELRNGAGVIATDGPINVSGGNPGVENFQMTLASDVTINAGDQLILRVANDEVGRADRQVTVYQHDATDGPSTLTFQTSTVINVDSQDAYSAAYPLTTGATLYQDLETVYIRAVVSDPFGSADITGATVDILDPASVLSVDDGVMSVVDSDAATRTYEYAFQVPVGATQGLWSFTVTTTEGTEGDITDIGNGGFGVGVAALAVQKSHSGDFIANGNGSFDIVVTNNGPLTLTQTTTVIDTLDASLSFVSGSGSGWDCTGSSGQSVSCSNAGDIAASGGTLPTLVLTVAVAPDAPAVVNNTAQVENPDVDGGLPQIGNTDAVTILRPVLSTSTKTVADLNGGDAAPGDTLRYTITVTESAGVAATGVEVTDDIPANVTGFTVSSIPAGSTNASGGGGANGTGFLDITNISIPANGSVAIVFDVTVGAVAAGTRIDNTVHIDNPTGDDVDVDARTITVLQSTIAGSGTKILYLYDTNTEMTRVPQASDSVAPVVINGNNGTGDWNMSPPVPAGRTLVLDDTQDVNVLLVMSTSGNGLNAARPVTAELRTSTGTIATSAPVNVQGASPNQYSFTIDIPAPVTLNPGDYLVLRIRNGHGTSNRRIAVYQRQSALSGQDYSTVSFFTSTVVNVDDVEDYDDDYAGGGTTPTYYVHGDTVYVRAVASDPFGSADVSGATIDLVDPLGNIVAQDVAMDEVADSGVATKTFEYGYTLPAAARMGTWTATVEATEGTEGEVTHIGVDSFEVRGSVSLTKAWGGTAPPGHAVTLAISGGTDATDGTSVAGGSTTPASAVSAGGVTLTLSEAFTTGAAGTYTISLACTKDSNGSAVTVTGTGLSRTIAMPSDSSVTCTWTNAVTVPLTVVKLSQVHSGPIHGTDNPKAIPGAYVDYTIIVTNPSANAIDPGTVVIQDNMPAGVDLCVTDLGAPGSGPVAFTDGSPSSGMTLSPGDVQYFDDLDPYVPTADVNGCDATVTSLRINPQGSFQPGGQFTILFRVRVE